MTYLADTLIVIFLCACCIACVYFSSDLSAGAEAGHPGWYVGSGE